MSAPHRSVQLGALTLRALERSFEGAPDGRALGELRVTLVETGERARWRPEHGLHGILSEAVGELTLLVEDPSGGSLAQRLAVTLPEPAAVRRALARGERAPWNPVRATLRLALGPGRALPEGQTRLWGEIRDADGQPCPWALLRLVAAGRVWVGGSDATGRWQLWPRGLPWRDEPGAAPAWPATLSVARALAPAPPWAADLDRMAEGAPDAARYGPGSRHDLTLRFGAMSRLDPMP